MEKIWSPKSGSKNFCFIEKHENIKFLKRSHQTHMYKGIKLILSCSLHSSLSLKTEHDATSFSHTSTKPSRRPFYKPHTNKWLYYSFQTTSEQNCSYQSPDVGDFCSPKTRRPLNSDYSARITTIVKVI